VIVRLLAIAAAAVILAPASPAAAGWWDYDRSAEDGPRLRFGPNVGFWIANFNRPSRACNFIFEGEDLPVATTQGRLRRAQSGRLAQDFGCFSSSSDEIAGSLGAAVVIHAWGPIHLGAGVDLIYTFPERDFALKNQLILALPLQVGLTPRGWPVRPFASFSLLPLLYLTDDARDYAIGFEAGFAARVPEIGELGLSGGYHQADTMEGFTGRIWVLLP
jgi:hypothetical protein